MKKQNDILMLERKWNNLTWLKFFDWLNIFCSLLIIIFAVWLYSTSDIHGQGGTIFACFAVISIVLLSIYIIRIHCLKKYRYSVVGEYFHDVIHLMRDSLFTEGLSDKEQVTAKYRFSNTIAESLDLISEVFTIVTRVKCSVCIKEIISDPEDQKTPLIQTLERDRVSRFKRKSFDRDPTINKSPLRDSSAFCEIFYNFNSYKNHFFSNDITKLYKKNCYDNATFLKVGKPQYKKIFGIIPFFEWPLPYKATIVFPIRHLESSDFLGFLCIDANHRNVFDKKLHVELGSAFADLFYIYIMSYKEKSIDNLLLDRLKEIIVKKEYSTIVDGENKA